MSHFKSEHPITFKVDGYEKTQYRYWCIEHAAANMSTALRLFVQCLVRYKPTWEQLVAVLAELEQGSE